MSIVVLTRLWESEALVNAIRMMWTLECRWFHVKWIVLLRLKWHTLFMKICTSIWVWTICVISFFKFNLLSCVWRMYVRHRSVKLALHSKFRVTFVQIDIYLKKKLCAYTVHTHLTNTMLDYCYQVCHKITICAK